MEASFVDGSPSRCIGGVVLGKGRPGVAATVVFFHPFAFNESSEGELVKKCEEGGK
jgi:hypothetical protein